MLHIDSASFTHDYNPVVMALSPLIIPCFDVVRVYLHRVRRHRNPFLPDKCHIHHKLLALGVNQRTALIVIMIWAALFIIVNVALSSIVNPTALIAMDVIIWTIANVVMTRRITAREQRLGQHLFD